MTERFDEGHTERLGDHRVNAVEICQHLQNRRTR